MKIAGEGGSPTCQHPLIGRVISIYAMQKELQLYRAEDLTRAELWGLEVFTIARMAYIAQQQQMRQ